MFYTVRELVLHVTNIYYELKHQNLQYLKKKHYPIILLTFEILLIITFNLITCVILRFKITFSFNSQYLLITCKRDLVLYTALLIVYNSF